MRLAVDIAQLDRAVLRLKHNIAPVGLPQFQQLAQGILVPPQVVCEIKAFGPVIADDGLQQVETVPTLIQDFRVLGSVDGPFDPPTTDPRQQRRLLRVYTIMLHQHRLDGFGGYRAQIDHLAAAGDGTQDRFQRGRQQNQHSMRRWFFQRFEQGILGAGLRPVEIVQQSDTITGLIRLHGDAVGHRPHRVNA